MLFEDFLILIRSVEGAPVSDDELTRHINRQRALKGLPPMKGTHA